MTRESKTTIESTAVTWDRAAASYDALRRSDPVYASCLRLTADAIPPTAKLCLDAGCGTGLSTAALAQAGRLVVAVDCSLESLKVLPDKCISSVLLVRADLGALPFADSVFDACMCANALQHLRPGGPQRNSVNQLARVTKAGGILSLSVHHFSRDKKKAGWIKEGKPGQPGIDYIYRFSRQDLAGLLPTSSIRGAGFYSLLRVPRLGRRVQTLFVRFFGRLAARLGFGHMLLAIWTKGKG